MLKKKKRNLNKTLKIKCKTPRGMFSYPYLAEPDSGRENSDDKFKVDHLIKKEVWKSDPDAKALRAAVLKVGRAFLKDDSLELSDFENPFKDTDKLEKYSANERVKGCILLRCKTEYKPLVVGANKSEKLPQEEIEKIKGGDEGRLVVVAYPYSNDGGGVTLGLNLVQWVKSGEALGQGAASSLAMIDDIEVEADELDPNEDAPDEEEEDDSEEESDDSEEEEEDDEEKPKKKVKKFEFDDSDSDDTNDDTDEDDEEEAPKKRRGRPPKKRNQDDE